MNNLIITRDMDPMDPRKEFDNLGTMVCWHRRYSLGDIQPKESPDDWRRDNLPPGSLELPLYLYDHSGITMNTVGFSRCDSARWDWGQIGFIFCPVEKVLAEYGEEILTHCITEKAIQVMESEVRIYDQYLQGEVWGYQHSSNDPEDSCWGFYGSTLEETGILEHLPADLDRKLIERAWEARS